MFKRITGILGDKEKEMSMSELYEWTQEEIDSLRKKIIDDGIPEAERTISGFKEVAFEVERIRDVEKELFRRLNNITKTSQRKFCESILNVIGRVSFDTRDYEGLVYFLKTSIEALSNIKKMDEMHGRVLYFSFEKEMKEFRASVKNVASCVAQLESTLSLDERRLTLLRDIRIKMQELEDDSKKAGLLEERLSSLEFEFHEEKKKWEGFSDLLRTLKDSPEFVSFKKRQEDIRDIQDGIRRVEEEIHGRLSPFVRIFKKVLSASRHGKASVDEKLLLRYEGSPFVAFLSEEAGYPRLKSLLADVLSCWDSIEDKDKPKLFLSMKNIKEGGLGELQEKRLSLIARKEKVLEDKSDVLDKVSLAENNSRDCVMRMREIESKIESTRKEMEEIKRRNTLISSTLRESAEKMGIKIKG